MTKEKSTIQALRNHIEALEETIKALEETIKALEQEPILDKIRAEIAEYGSLRVSYAITKDTKTDKGIEKLVSDVLKRAKEEILDIIDKYRAERGTRNDSN